MTHSEISKTEKFGSRDYDTVFLGVCAKCNFTINSDNGEACRDSVGNLFCTRDCFDDYHGYRELG
jgi:hypothetical protein